MGGTARAVAGHSGAVSWSDGALPGTSMRTSAVASVTRMPSRWLHSCIVAGRPQSEKIGSTRRKKPASHRLMNSRSRVGRVPVPLHSLPTAHCDYNNNSRRHHSKRNAYLRR